MNNYDICSDYPKAIEVKSSLFNVLIYGFKIKICFLLYPIKAKFYNLQFRRENYGK